MPVADVAYVRDVANIPLNTIADAKISVWLPRAERRMRTWVGDAAYDDALLAVPTDPDRAQAIKDAEAQLVVAMGIRSWATAWTTGGIAKQRDTGTDGQQVILLTPDEINTLVRLGIQEAERTVAEYVIEHHAVPILQEAADEDEEEDDG